MYSFSLSRQIIEEIELFKKIDFIGLLKLVNSFKHSTLEDLNIDNKNFYANPTDNKDLSNKKDSIKENFCNEFIITININLETELINLKDSFSFDLLSEYTQ